MDSISTEHQATGRVRGRLQRLTGKVIMQVEFQVVQCVVPCGWPCPPPPWCLDPAAWYQREQEKLRQLTRITRSYWRDARPEDVAVVKTYQTAESA